MKVVCVLSFFFALMNQSISVDYLESNDSTSSASSEGSISDNDSTEGQVASFIRGSGAEEAEVLEQESPYPEVVQKSFFFPLYKVQEFRDQFEVVKSICVCSGTAPELFIGGLVPTRSQNVNALISLLYQTKKNPEIVQFLRLYDAVMASPIYGSMKKGGLLFGSTSVSTCDFSQQIGVLLGVPNDQSYDLSDEFVSRTMLRLQHFFGNYAEGRILDNLFVSYYIRKLARHFYSNEGGSERFSDSGGDESQEASSSDVDEVDDLEEEQDESSQKYPWDNGLEEITAVVQLTNQEVQEICNSLKLSKAEMDLLFCKLYEGMDDGEKLQANLAPVKIFSKFLMVDERFSPSEFLEGFMTSFLVLYSVRNVKFGDKFETDENLAKLQRLLDYFYGDDYFDAEEAQSSKEVGSQIKNMRETLGNPFLLTAAGVQSSYRAMKAVFDLMSTSS